MAQLERQRTHRRFARFAALIAATGLLVFTVHFAGADTPDGRFHKLAAGFVEHWLSQRPHVATGLGLHRWDTRLTPVTRSTLAREAEWLKLFRLRLEAIDRAELSFEHALEYDLLAARLERELFEIEVMRPYENDPNAYLDLVAGSIEALLLRNFASLCTRMQWTARRLHEVPEVLRAARINLRNPPRVSTEVAIEQFEGVLRFYREELPVMAAACRIPRLQADFAEADTVAVRAVESFVAFLRDDLLPRSREDFAWGREVLQRKLAVEEMETAPLDSLLARGLRELEETRSRMAVLAAIIAPGLGPRAALDSLAAMQPPAARLMAEMSDRLEQVRLAVVQRDVVTAAAANRVSVREMPSFRRSLSRTAMNAPGIWERRATEAYLHVTPVERAWPAAHRRDHLAFFNRYAADILLIHQVFPGRYVQAMAARRIDSRVRQLLGSRSGSEGWACYCERMMIEQGYGADDPRFEVAQLHLGLQQLGRLVAGIALHTRGMTRDEAVTFFQDQCFMSPTSAAYETRRVMLDPAYLVDTLGKWRILELREEVRQRLGERYRLRDFHDAFLRQGAAPFPVARAGVLRQLGLEVR